MIFANKEEFPLEESEFDDLSDFDLSLSVGIVEMGFEGEGDSNKEEASE